MTEETLFEQAVQLSAAERVAFLDRECPDPVLRARVEALLAIDGASNSPFDGTRSLGNATAGRSLPPSPAPEEAEGVVIAGRYKLRQQIGEGGMGTVWMADQTEPVKRKVAVKLIRVERGQSRTILARFEAERQAIAVMDHPHIAKLLDAGTTDTGAPFFVMELVKGVPLTDYCDQHNLTVAERLNLFTRICSAVQHAHQKGIIHRDLKPGNILVECHDGKPVPKVIDFGLAKATTGLQLTDQSMFTAFGSVMGTPLYMAPEQATFNAVDVDTRADVYALGVILYELLTGTTPLTRETMKKAALDEMLKLIREQEAPPPSSRLSSADSAPSVAANRQIEPTKLGRFVKGELDWIVMKALSKERDRRYETANGFARDIERFLNHEPVQAGPPSASYRFKKFVRRNRVQVVAASLVLLALVAGVVGTTLGLLEARRQTEFAREQEAEAKKQKTEAVKQAALAREEAAAKELARAEEARQRSVAERETKVAQAVNDFLQDKLLAQADTTAQANALLRARGLVAEAKLNPTIRELLDRAAKELAPDKIEANFPKQPLVQAQILRTVGDAYQGIGEAATALPFLIRSVDLFKAHLGPDRHDTLLSTNNLARCYSAAGKPELALPLAEETLQRTKAKRGADHHETLTSMSNLAMSYLETGKPELAIPLLEEHIKRSRATHGADHSQTLFGMNNLATCYMHADRLALALPLYEETLTVMKAQLGPDHPSTLNCMHNLASCYVYAEKLDKGLPLAEETLKLCKAKFGPDHPKTLACMNNLAGIYRAAGKINLAIPLYEQSLQLSQAKLGADHPVTAKSMNNLASAYQVAGKLSVALPLFEQSHKLITDQLGVDHPAALSSMNNLALGYLEAGKLDLALPLLEETVKRTKAKFGPDHQDALTSLVNLATGYIAAAKYDQALPLLEETLQLRKAKFGLNNALTRHSMGSLAEGYREAGKMDLAMPLYEETLKLTKENLGADHPETLVSMNNLALGYLTVAKFDESLALYGESLKLCKAKLGPDHPTTLQSMSGLASVYHATRKPALALPLEEETFKRRKAKLGLDHPHTLNNMNSLAASYWALKRLDDAIPLFEQLLPLQEKRLGRRHPHTLNTVGNLGVNYKDAGRVTEALPLLEEAYRASKQYPHLRFAGPQLLDAYDRAGKQEEVAQLIGELLPDARKTLPKNSLPLASTLAKFSLHLMAAKKFPEAEPLLRECLSILEKAQPDSWSPFFTQSLLGGTLLGQMKYADAEPLLLKGYEGMKAREKTIPPDGATRVPEAIDRLIELYTATNKPDEVRKYQELRAQYSTPMEVAPMPKEKQ